MSLKQKINNIVNENNSDVILIDGISQYKQKIINNFKQDSYKIINFDFLKNNIVTNNKNFTLKDLFKRHSKSTWDKLYKIVNQCNKQIIINGTFMTRKRRKHIIKMCKDNSLSVNIIYVETPLEEIYNEYIPEHIIKMKIKNQTLPIKQEGFNKIFILHTHLRDINIKKNKILKLKNSDNLFLDLKNMYKTGELKDIFPTLNKCWGVDQENKHHNLLLHKHIIKVAKELKDESKELFIAGLLHDIGKIKTKECHGKILVDTDLFNKGDKVIISNRNHGLITVKQIKYNFSTSKLLTKDEIKINNNCHYYGHDKVSARIARRRLIELGFNENFANKVYLYILYHMALPFNRSKQKTLRKIIKKVGKNNIKEIIKIRKADKLASSSKKYLKNVHDYNINIIENIFNNNYY
jgi:predicted kinase